MRLNTKSFLPILLCCTCLCLAQQPAALDSGTREELRTMLRTCHDEIFKNYYDKKNHGVDMEALYRAASTKLNSVQSLNQGFAAIAAYVEALHDSHTFFEPPARNQISDAGFNFKMIDDKAFVTEVRPGTDAATKLHPGDQVLSYDGFKLERSTFDMLEYYFRALATTSASVMQLRSPDGQVRREVVKHTLIERPTSRNYSYDSGGTEYLKLKLQTEQDQRMSKPRFLEAGDVLVWKQPEFDLEDEDMDSIFWHKAEKHAVVVMDLRGNPGGAVSVLESMLGHFFDHEITIATLEARKPEKPLLAKPKFHQFHGKVVVLLDSRSGSCAEIFARVMQLEHRGTVVGEPSWGRVMEAQNYPESLGGGSSAYAIQVTRADLHMTDGKSVENVGVTPDEVILPTARDIADAHDVVLERAVTENGGTYDAKAAAKAFPYLWPNLELAK